VKNLDFSDSSFAVGLAAVTDVSADGGSADGLAEMSKPICDASKFRFDSTFIVSDGPFGSGSYNQTIRFLELDF
jgi:hypothetical protein